MTEQAVRKKLKNIPARPGVYLFKDAGGGVIYVGKALSLKNRVGSYFHRSAKDEKIVSLVENIRDLDYILTANEVEALLLECTLIKKHRPRFNVRLKDDTGYPFLKVTSEEYPRLIFARKREADGARYFGPYSSARDVRRTMRFLQRIFPLRLCRELKKHPCMYFHIEKCAGPCCDDFDPDEYSGNVESVVMFLRGRRRAVVDRLRREMKEAATATQFERAAVLRDRLNAVESVLGDRQHAVVANAEDCDAVGLAVEDGTACAVLLAVREGAICGQNCFLLDTGEGKPPNEVLDGFLKLHYSQADDFPREILVGEEIEGGEIEKLGRERTGRSVKLVAPKRGKKRSLVKMAGENAAHRLEVELKRRAEVEEKSGSMLAALARRLGDDAPPSLIAGMDISTIQRTDTVGSMVTFRNGAAWKSGYRKFIVKGKEDDISAMREVAKRYFARVRDGKEEAPDLVIVDGGRGQLGAVAEGIEKAGLEEAPEVISFAKESLLSYRMGEDEPIAFEEGEEAVNLVKRVIAEAHRFAISFHRKRRRKKAFK